VPRAKKQVAQRHRWRGPERDDKAQHQRMPQEFVNKRRPEANLLVLHSTQVEIDLSQPEELKVVDEKSGLLTDQNCSLAAGVNEKDF
jgi:hypothetical protein